MKLLTKQDILNAEDLPTEDVEVPEWGGDVRVRTLTACERDAFEASLLKKEGRKHTADLSNARAKLVALCLVDGNGSRLFEANEVKMLGTKSAAAMDRVYAVAQRLNGMTDKDIEELEKNSGAGEPGDLPSD